MGVKEDVKRAKEEGRGGRGGCTSGGCGGGGQRLTSPPRVTPVYADGMGWSSVSPCDLDRDFAPQITQLLTTPPLHSIKEYYDELIESGKQGGIRVTNSDKHGKGVCANRDFDEGDLVLKDQMLVGAQHSFNKTDCMVCSYCFRFIGSVEFQIGQRLYLQSIGTGNDGTFERHCHGSDAGSSTGCSSATNGNAHTVPKEVIMSLMAGDMQLPFTERFALPSVVACPGGCEGELYCSQSCADSDWDSYHSLLCTGSKTEPLRRSTLQKFVEHANGTNDIFLVAAKAITYTMLRYRNIKRQHASQNKKDESSFSFLMEAWKPLSMGFKKRWWECVSLPEGVDSSEEDSFRQGIRDMAFTSLQLLRDAIFDPECAPLFSLDVYGHIISMFEPNYLASPVEKYFVYIDHLPDSEKEEAEKVTGPFLNALGEDYSVPCQGMALFPLQSCINHSACPNAKAFKRDEDKDGHAVIIALKRISNDDEITISYIDEVIQYEERQAQLADYDFRAKKWHAPEHQRQLPNQSGVAGPREKTNEEIEANVKLLTDLMDDCLSEMRNLLCQFDVGQMGHNKFELQLKLSIDEMIVITVELEKNIMSAEKCLNTMHCKEQLVKIEELIMAVERCHVRILKPIRVFLDLIKMQMKDFMSEATTELPKLEVDLNSLVVKLTQIKHDILLKLSDVSAIESGHEDDVMLEYELRSQNADKLTEEARKERKVLLNKILDIKGNTRVFCRVRRVVDDVNSARTSIVFPEDDRCIELQNKGSRHCFTFDRVFSPDDSQDDIFMEVSELVESSLNGYKVCIFSYGQTGSGKTYTMMGKKGTDHKGIDQKGLIPRSLEQIFEAKKSKESEGWKYSIQVSVLEIYKENIRDLLATDNKKLSINHVNATVPGLTDVDVFSVTDVVTLLNKASRLRSVGRTQMNEESSRSHFVLTLKIRYEHADEQHQGVLNLIDLAGSENINKSGVMGDRLSEDEAKVINKSLTFLRTVFKEIAIGAPHVSFRNSTLTGLLQPCLSGQAKVLMIVNVSPEAASTEETLKSLKFANEVNNCIVGSKWRS